MHRLNKTWAEIAKSEAKFCLLLHFLITNSVADPGFWIRGSNFRNSGQSRQYLVALQ